MNNKHKHNIGELKEILIKNGLLLLNKVGYQDFSIRKVAAMSGVSHAAPYKHFKDKEELITAISMSVVKSFKNSLAETALIFAAQPHMCLIELGKKYVQFMVENPEYMKSLFLTPSKYSVKITDNQFIYNENSAFAVFRDVASAYLDSIGADPAAYVTDILTMWSIVHGISILICEKSISFDGDYLKIVTDMLYNQLKLKCEETIP